MSVPALSGPHPQTPGAPQKTITQLLTQWKDLTNAAIAATGDTENWYYSPIIEKKPWDPAAEDVQLWNCHTRGSDDASQVQANVVHEAFDRDPHPIADKLTQFFKDQGFTVTRTVDWKNPSTGDMDISIRATRADGVFYGLTATHQIVAIGVTTECSADPSIDAWAEEGVQKRLDALFPPTDTPTPTPTPTHTPAARAETADPSALFREFHEDPSMNPTAADTTTDDDDWNW
jgi:hypothetical protein